MPQAGRSVGHRKQWIEDRLLKLCDCFAASICGNVVKRYHPHHPV
jgi:hypothetical protein